jgi:hypothetical protein
MIFALDLPGANCKGTLPDPIAAALVNCDHRLQWNSYSQIPQIDLLIPTIDIPYTGVPYDKILFFLQPMLYQLAAIATPVEDYSLLLVETIGYHIPRLHDLFVHRKSFAPF